MSRRRFTMTYRLAPEHAALVDRIIDSGRYDDADQVIGEALRQLDEREQRLAQLRAALAIAEEQIARGEVVEWTPQLHAEILREARKAAKAGEKPKADVCP
jgi:putative addiction module CopG family antidote